MMPDPAPDLSALVSMSFEDVAAIRSSVLECLAVDGIREESRWEAVATMDRLKLVEDAHRLAAHTRDLLEVVHSGVGPDALFGAVVEFIRARIELGCPPDGGAVCAAALEVLTRRENLGTEEW